MSPSTPALRGELAPEPAGAGDDLGALLDTLTSDAAKAAAYRDDTYVHESIDQLVARGTDVATFASTHSIVLLKPDALVARAIDPTLAWLDTHGYVVVAAERVTTTRHLARALWYFSWNVASPERRRLADLLVRVCDAVALVVAGGADDPSGGTFRPVGASTAERLTVGKGPTDPRRRRAGHLRHALGDHGYLLNLVHTPDDPADVLREYAILFDEPTRDRILTAAATGTRVDPADVRALAPRFATDSLAASSPDAAPHGQHPAGGPFDRAAAAHRVATDLRGLGIDCTPVDPEDDADCASLVRRAFDAIRALPAASGRPGEGIDPWAVVVLGAGVLPMQRDPGRILIPRASHPDRTEDRS